MIEAKHTPGPWVYERNISNHESEMRTAAGSVLDCADGWRLCKIEVNGPHPDADGQLMAAAPEMLSALTEALANVERVTDGGRNASPDVAQWLEKARAAIAKAKGGA